MRIIPRSEWGARHGRGGLGRATRDRWWVHTEAGAIVPRDWSIEDAMARVRQIEDFHTRPISQGGRGWQAIGYSFLIDPLQGWIFEGRGWARNGGHTQGYNLTSYAGCFLGHGDIQGVADPGWFANEWLIREGLRGGYLTTTYRVGGHRDVANKSCPGDLIYPYIGRLRGLTSQQEDVSMALTEAQVQQAVLDAFDSATFLAEWQSKQYIVREVTQQAVHIKTPAEFDALRRAFPHRGTLDVTTEYEVVE